MKQMKDKTMRLYAILREDLQMNCGKSCSQAGHAFLNTFLEAHKVNPDILPLYQEGGLGTKVVLVAHDLADLMFAYYQAKDLNIPTSLITDSGHILPPHFDGTPIVTAMGIGPATRQQLNGILRRFRTA